jgi:hypothetical protein
LAYWHSDLVMDFLPLISGSWERKKGNGGADGLERVQIIFSHVAAFAIMTIILWYHKTSTQYILLPAVLPAGQLSVSTLFSAFKTFDLGYFLMSSPTGELNAAQHIALTCFTTNMKNVQWDVHVQQLRACPVQPICDIVILTVVFLYGVVSRVHMKRSTCIEA